MEAHGDDLRAEVGDAAFVDAIKRDWRGAALEAPDRALFEYAEKLTRAPWSAGPDDVDALRGHGFTDEQISDAAQVIAYFNYINRIADGLGIDLEPDMARPSASEARP